MGAAVANRLASVGARTIAVGLNSETNELQSGIEVRIGDVSVADDVEQLFKGLDELDIVVNCAGIIRRGAEHEPAVLEQVLAVNLTGPMRICSAAAERLARRRGCIVNTVSFTSFLNT